MQEEPIKKTYTFRRNNLQAIQENLTIKERNNLLKFISSISISKLGDALSPENLDKQTLSEFLINIMDENIEQKFLQLILKSPDGSLFPDHTIFDHIHQFEVEEVIDDFFTFNPMMKKLWETIKTNSASQILTTLFKSSANTANPEAPNSSNQTSTNSYTPLQEEISPSGTL